MPAGREEQERQSAEDLKPPIPKLAETPEERLIKAWTHSARTASAQASAIRAALAAAGELSGLSSFLTPVWIATPEALIVPHLIERWVASHAPIAEIKEITDLAFSVIENKESAEKWLSEPNLATDNRPPIDLIGEKDGFERVKNLLLRIEYGVLA